jgi:glycosyltransferase involved in cell wall biosynthesis
MIQDGNQRGLPWARLLRCGRDYTDGEARRCTGRPLMLDQAGWHGAKELTVFLAHSEDSGARFRRHDRPTAPFRRGRAARGYSHLARRLLGLPDYAKHIAAAKARYGLRFAFLIYDMIPIEYASLVERRHTLQFRKWLQETASDADVILTISQYSRQVLLDFAAAAGWTLPRVDVVRLGGGVSPRPTADGRSKICLPGQNVLFVSTIEIRKNHRLLVRVWRRLIARHGTEAVPTLIFAGQIGWMVDNLLADLAASDHLGGKIEHKPSLSDEELDEAYRRACSQSFRASAKAGDCRLRKALRMASFALLRIAHLSRRWAAT